VYFKGSTHNKIDPQIQLASKELYAELEVAGDCWGRREGGSD
jgi:hypothetical protein